MPPSLEAPLLPPSPSPLQIPLYMKTVHIHLLNVSNLFHLYQGQIHWRHFLKKQWPEPVRFQMLHLLQRLFSLLTQEISCDSSTLGYFFKKCYDARSEEHTSELQSR